MFEDIEGKRVFISGSSAGLGFCLAKRFKGLGARVAINGRNAKNLDIANDDIMPDLSVVGDVSCPKMAQVIAEQVISAFDGLDILVCNVGSGRSAPPGAEVHSDWAAAIAVNLYSATNMVQVFQRELVKSAGSITCISSICGVETIPGAPVTYSAAKASLNAFVKGISKPLGKAGVRINAIAPGNLLFDGSSWEQKLADDKKSVEQMRICIPLSVR